MSLGNMDRKLFYLIHVSLLFFHFVERAYSYLIRVLNNDCVRHYTKSRFVAFEKELNKGRPNWNGKQGTIFYLPQGGNSLNVRKGTD